MTPRLRDTCLRCGTDNMVPYAHWRICPNCEPEFLAAITMSWEPVIELQDKGLPSRAGGTN